MKRVLTTERQGLRRGAQSIFSRFLRASLRYLCAVAVNICVPVLFLSPLLAANPVTISTNFEGGSLGKIEAVSALHFRCGVKGESDQDGRNRQANWYYFRVNNARGKSLTIDLVDLPGEYNYRPNRGAVTGDTIPWYSEDNRHWQQVEVAEYQADTPLLRLRLTPRTKQLWIAHVPPYTNQHLQQLLRELTTKPHWQQQTIGKTVQGRDLLLLTITDERVPPIDKKVLWLMFRQHSWEAGSSWVGEGVLRFLLSDAPAAVILRQTVIVKIFPLCDPDGVARGGVRFNANGYDLNRNWDAVDASKMPEIAAQRKAVLDWVDGGNRVDMFLSLHNTETSEYLEGPPDIDARQRRLMERFFRLLSTSKAFAPSDSPQTAPASTTIGKPGRMTVVQGLYHDRQLPAFLIELRIAKHPKLGHQPNPADRQQFGADLVQAMWQAIGR